MNRDMTLLDRFGENIKEVQKYSDRVDVLSSSILEKLDLSRKFDLN
jgi:hypothetical protein